MKWQTCNFDEHKEARPMSFDPLKTKTIGKYQAAHGRDYEIEIRATDEYKTSRTRDNISYIIICTSLIALALAGGYGFYVGTFGAVKDVWAVAGPLIGSIVGYYFHRARKAPE